MEFVGFTLRNNLFVAPMAGVTDRPFRQLCKKMGAGLAVSEMVTSNSLLYGSAKTQRRANHDGEVAPISVQIAGADPAMMAEAARHNVDHGAQIIDINMGCPAKKVCNVMAGSALMQDEPLVGQILDAVVAAVPNTPVTLKFRTGWNQANRNAPTIARIAEAVRHPRHRHPRPHALPAVHRRGRVRHHRPGQDADQHSGHRQRRHHDAGKGQARARRHRRRRHDDRPRRPGPPLAVPRDRALPEDRRRSCRRRRSPRSTASCSRTWTISTLSTARKPAFKVARKHISWYTKGLVGSAAFRQDMNPLPSIEQQMQAVNDFFRRLAEEYEHLKYNSEEALAA